MRARIGDEQDPRLVGPIARLAAQPLEGVAGDVAVVLLVDGAADPELLSVKFPLSGTAQFAAGRPQQHGRTAASIEDVHWNQFFAETVIVLVATEM